ncbi:MAG: nucleotidyltransferase domain-containing protein [Cyanobacteria bacterium P01_H01_bin.121]
MALLDQLREQRAQILAIASQHGAFNVRVFGSVVRGEETPESDVDLLVDYDLDRITPWFPVRLVRDLEAALDIKVDVVTSDGLKTRLQDQILQESISL